MKVVEQKKILFAFMAFPILFANSTYADTGRNFAGSYYCIADAVGGVRYNENSGKWVGTSFSATGRYLMNIRENVEVVSDLDNVLRLTYFVSFSKHGAQFDPIFDNCYTQSNQLRAINSGANFIFENGAFSCNLLRGELRVNLANLRFLKSYVWGYTDGIDENSNTPHIEVGTCTKIN